MSSFKEMLTKFSTQKKLTKKEPKIKEFTMSEPATKNEMGTINLELSEGWQYSG